MQYDPHETAFVLSTGKRFYAHGGRLCPSQALDVLGYGSDGEVGEADRWAELGAYRYRTFTDAEVLEIQQWAIGHWQDWVEDMLSKPYIPEQA